jgi:hypothetical protein
VLTDPSFILVLVIVYDAVNHAVCLGRHRDVVSREAPEDGLDALLHLRRGVVRVRWRRKSLGNVRREGGEDLQVERLVQAAEFQRREAERMMARDTYQSILGWSFQPRGC